MQSISFKQLLSLLFLSAIVWIACSSKSDEPKPQTEQTLTDGDNKQPETLVVYSGRSQKIVDGLFKQFEAASGIRLRVKYGESQPLATSLIKEGQLSKADLFLAQDASTLGFLEAKNVFKPLPEHLLKRVDKRYRSKNGFWVGLSGRARVLTYNSDKFKPNALPSIDDLTTSPWKGRVGWAPENASFKSFVNAMVELRGPEKTLLWLNAMVANSPKAYPKNTPAVRAVARREIDIALTNHYYLYRIKDELGQSTPIANHYSKSGDAASLVNISGIALTSTTKKQAMALKLIDFLLNEKAQTYFATNTHEFPLIPNIKAGDLPAIASLNTPSIDLTSLSQLETTETLLRKAGAID